MRTWIIFGLVALVGGAATAGPPSGVTYRDITEASGISFRHTFGDRNFTKILKATGAGVGIFDYDGDGDLDLYFVNGCYLPEICDEAGKANEGAVNRLYRNDGVDPGTGVLHFTDMTVKAGVGDGGFGMGCVVADYDNDGDTDLFVTNYGPNVLYRNNGNGTFTDVSAKTGVAGPEKLSGWTKWSTNAVFFDYDRDGDLDLYVTNYLAFDPEFDAFYGPEGFPGPKNYLGQPSILYRNEGRDEETGGFRFTDVTKAAGVFRKRGRGMGTTAADLNGDGWPDLYEANDAMVNYLFLNGGDGTFRDVAEDSLTSAGQGGENTASMHPSAGDYNRDGRLDLFIPDMNYFSLYENRTEPGKTPIFKDATTRSGIAAICGQFVGWGGFFFDYDNDGWLDIFVANGAAHRPENQPSLVLRNTGDGKFEDVSLSLGKRLFWQRRLSRGALAADLDNDGDLDLVKVNIDVKAKGREGLPQILVNEGGNARSWLQIRLVGKRSNRDGIGAKVRVTAGGTTWFAEPATSPSYLSSAEPRLHFGLGDVDKVDRIEIDWPSGARQLLQGIKANQLLTVSEKGGD